jgi:hypothetical protein
VLLTGLMLGATTRPAGACSCYALPLHDYVSAATAIFQGTVTTVDGPHTWTDPQTSRVIGPMRTAHFTVERVWKGTLSSEAQIATSAGLCGSFFTVGERYLVWATAGFDGTLMVSGCGPTTSIDELRVAELDRLAAQQQGLTVTTTGMIVGVVTVLLLGIVQVAAGREQFPLRPTTPRVGGLLPQLVRRILGTMVLTVLVAFLCSGTAFVLSGLDECGAGPAGRDRDTLLLPRC